MTLPAIGSIVQEGAPGFTPSARSRLANGFVLEAGAHYREHFLLDPQSCAISLERVDGDDPKDVDGLHPVDPACVHNLRG